MGKDKDGQALVPINTNTVHKLICKGREYCVEE